MYAFGFSINNMTLLALTLSVGFVVDDAIVMLENIVRHIEGGMRPFEAALKGSREIGFTIMSITFSLIAVFIPVLLMGGIVGRVFREFAVSIAVAIIVSGFVSLTLTPMLCARVLRGHHEEEKKQAFILRIFERVFQIWLRSYEWALDKVLAYKAVTLVITFATIVGTVWLYIIIPKGFFPTEDTGFMLAITEAQSDISFDAMVERQRKIAEIIRADKAVLYVNSTVGTGGPNATANQGRMLVALKPKSERGPLNPIIQRFRRETGGVTGMAVFFQMIQNINVGGKINKSQYQYTLQSSDTDTLYRIAPELRDKIAKVPGLLDVTTDLYVKNPQVMIEVDREKAAVYGVTVDQIRQELFNAFGTRQVATIYTATNDYQVILEAAPEFRMDPSSLSKIFVKTNGGGSVAGTTSGPGSGVTGNGIPSGQSIPLSAVTKPVSSVGPLLVNHQGQQPAVTISFNLAPGYALGQAVDAIKQIERESNLPATITTGFQGTAQVFQESLKGQGILILAAIFAAYVVLGILYESFIHPITIISGLPSAGIGALLTLLLFRHGFVRHRHDRHRHAGRNREEERDHDDRLRDRTPPGGLERRGGDPGSVPVALPADHDDDVRSDLRRVADRARVGRGCRIASAARHCGGRRAVALAAPDPVHHAGRLHLSRPHRPHAQAPARAAAAGGAGASRPADGGGGGVRFGRRGTDDGGRAQFPSSFSCGLRYSEKLVPQPQEALACGLLTRNEAPIRSSTKSISEPAR